MLLLKFKMAATDKLQFFCGRKNSQTSKSEIIQILLSHSPRYLKVLLNFKMAAMDELLNFL